MNAGIGIPRERKDGERRVGMTPGGVRALCAEGHVVRVEAGAGVAVGFSDEDYRRAGAIVEPSAAPVWASTIVVKVKEIQPSEYPLLVSGTTIFSFAQLNRDRALTDAVLGAGVCVIAYETVRDRHGALPLLAPMSRIAGRLAPLVGAMALTAAHGGSGVLLTGVEDVPPGNVVVIGAGNVGTEAVRVAAALGCRVDVFSRGAKRLSSCAASVGAAPGRVRTFELGSGGEAFTDALATADLVIGAVLEPGTLSPKLLSRAMVRSMRRGSAIVDVGIDQGGIAETSRATKLSEPTYVDEGVVHYAVPNMPSLVARTATMALTDATLPYIGRLVRQGVPAALRDDPALAAGCMVRDGHVLHPGLARDQGRRSPPRNLF